MALTSPYPVMMAAGENVERVTDDDIAEIIAEHEAGISDLMAAYVPVEQYYMAAAQVQMPTIVASSNTVAR